MQAAVRFIILLIQTILYIFLGKILLYHVMTKIVNGCRDLLTRRISGLDTLIQIDHLVMLGLLLEHFLGMN
jgi:hypothetical protein